MSMTLRYMQLSDIQQVATIDESCFQPPWSRDSYAFEINESTISHMVVLDRRPDHPPPATQGQNGWLSLLNGILRGERQAGDGRGDIVGYGGLWKIEGEAHISTIATHPHCRGNGFGEILLAGMFGKALRLNAEFIVLEVRVSNGGRAKPLSEIRLQPLRAQKKLLPQRQRRRLGNARDAGQGKPAAAISALYDDLQTKHGFRDTYSWKTRPRR